MKTRMQTTQKKNHYNNLFDAFYKTYHENMPRKAAKPDNMVKNVFNRLKRFYTAMPIYGGTYVTFIAIEFSLYEVMLRKIENQCEGKSLVGYSLERVKALKDVQ